MIFGEGKKITKSKVFRTSVISVSIILFLLLNLVHLTYAGSVGVIPTDVNLGHVSRGNTYTGTVYLSTTSGGNVVLRPSYIKPVSNPWFSAYISEYSEERISSWVSFPDQITVDGSKAFNINIDGVSSRANYALDFQLTIPKDAEPGYHAGSINFVPVSESSTGAEVQLYALVRPNFVFRVAGDVIRKGEITRMDAERQSENTAVINIYFKNTGTNTISTSIDDSSVKIYNDNNEIRGEYKVSSLTLSPGEEQLISIEWSSREGIPDGRYRVNAIINYRSGQSEKSDFVTVPSMITISDITPAQIEIEEPVDAIPTRACSVSWMTPLIIALIVGMILFWKMPNLSVIKIVMITLALFVILFVLSYLFFCYSAIWAIVLLVLLAIIVYYLKNP